MTRNKNTLTDADRTIICKALEENGWTIRPTFRALREQGHPYALGTIHNVAAEHKSEETIQSRLAATEAQVRSLRTRNSYLKRLYGDSLKFNDEILAAVGTIPPPTTIKVKPPKIPTTPVAVVNPLCDWHIAEVITKEELEGFNEYNFAIAEARVHFLSQKVIDWVEVQRSGYTIDEIYLPLLGDFISGNIHDELIATNEFPLPVACVKAARLLAWYISRMSPHFKRIIVDGLAADNHGRVPRKRGSKHKGTNNWNYVIYELMQAYLKDHKNVKFTQHISTKVQIDIAGKSFLCEHGDTVRGWQGLPYYGMVRANDKEARKRLKHGKPFDEVLRAHFHTVSFGEECGILCGSLIGTTELDVQATRWSLPYQISFLVHPAHGWHNFCRWDLSKVKGE